MSGSQLFPLQKTFVVGWSDVSFAGCRAILGSKCQHSRTSMLNFTFDGFELKSQLKLGDEELPSACIVNCVKRGVTMFSFTSHLSSSCYALVFNALLDIFNASNSTELVVVAAMQIKIKSIHDSEVFQIAVNCKEVDSIPSLPDDFLIKDSALNMLIQLVQVEGIPMRCFLTRGYKISSGKPSTTDGSEQCIEQLQGVLSNLYQLEFNREKTLSLECIQAKDNTSTNLMYL